MSATIFRGSSAFNPPMLTVDDAGWVYEGAPVFGAPIMKIAGDSIYRGSTSWGEPLATVKGRHIYKGTGFLSAPIATVSGEYVYKGASAWLAPIATIRGGGKKAALAAAAYLLLY